jgi:hypothetical protein
MFQYSGRISIEHGCTSNEALAGVIDKTMIAAQDGESHADSNVVRTVGE